MFDPTEDEDTQPTAPPNESFGQSARWTFDHLPTVFGIVGLASVLIGIFGSLLVRPRTAPADAFTLLFWLGEALVVIMLVWGLILLAIRRRQVNGGRR